MGVERRGENFFGTKPPDMIDFSMHDSTTVSLCDVCTVQDDVLYSTLPFYGSRMNEDRDDGRTEQ